MVGIGKMTVTSTCSSVPSSLREEGDRKMYPKVDLSPEGVMGIERRDNNKVT